MAKNKLLKTKVLITGAKGTLGGDLVRVFKKDRKYQVFGWDLAELDITDKKMVKNQLEKLKPQIIINASAYNAVDKAEESRKEFALAKKINGQGPENLANLAKQLGSIFIHYVSDYIFAGRKKSYQEIDKPKPISNYGKSKLEGEERVKKVGGKFFLIRTSKLFGPIGNNKNSKKSFFQLMLELADKNKELKVINEELSCFTYTPDLAIATKQLIEKRYSFGIYHLVNEGAATWFEGAKKLFSLAKKKIKLIPVSAKDFPRPAKRPKYSVLKNTKFPPLRHYESALKDWLKTL